MPTAAARQTPDNRGVCGAAPARVGRSCVRRQQDRRATDAPRLRRPGSFDGLSPL